MFISLTHPMASADADQTSSGVPADRVDNFGGYVKSDQAGTLFVEQSFDGSNWDISDSFAFVANTTKTFNVSLTGSRVRLRVDNTSGSDQTFLRVYGKGVSAGDS